MAGVQISKSKEVRARLHHPVIDSDGHTVEFEPAVMDTLREIGDRVSSSGIKPNGLRGQRPAAGVC